MNQFNKRVRTNTGNIFNINYSNEEDTNNTGGGSGGGGGATVAVVNNLVTNDPDAALSAAQGVVLKGITDTTNGQISGIQEALNTVDQEITSLGDRTTVLEGQVSSFDANLYTLQQTVAQNTTDITAVNTRVDGVNGDINSIYQDLNTVDINVTGLLNKVDQSVTTSSTPTFQNALIAGQTFSTVYGRLQTAETNITNNTGNITLNTNSINTLNGRVNQDVRTTASPTFVAATIGGTTFTSVLTRMTTAESNITTNTSNITSNTSSITSLLTRMTTVETTLSNDINQDVRSSAAPTFQSLKLKNGTDGLAQGRFIHFLDTSANSPGNTRYFCFGSANSAGNQAEFGWVYQGLGSGSNETYIGFHSYRSIECFYDGRVQVNGSVILQNNTSTALNVEGSMNWNGTNKVPRFYNGTTWNDLATSTSASSTLGKAVGSLCYTFAKNSSSSVESIFEVTGVVTAAALDGSGRIVITLSSDPGTLSSSITTMGISGSLPAHLRFTGYRSTSTTYTIAGTTGAPPASDPQNIYNAMINLNTLVTTDTGLCLRIVLFKVA